jgi:hypothetical protein
VSFADDLVAAFEPWWTQDLEDYLRSIATMFEEVDAYIADPEGELEPWEILFDPDLAPAAALPFLAMLVGETLPQNITEAGAREWIKDRPNSRRGTPQAIIYAAQRYLTGQRTVSYRERWDGSTTDVDHVTINTFNHEMGNTTPAQVEAEIRSVFPADIVLNYSALDGQTWADVITDYTTWADVLAEPDYDTWADVVTDLPDSNIFTRPGP